MDVVSYFHPSLEAASRRCLAQVEVGVNLPWALFDRGKFGLMLRRPYEALGYYAKGVGDSSAAFFLDSALGSFAPLRAAGEALPGLDWSHDFLRLAKAVRFPDAPPGTPPTDPVVVVVGSADAAIPDDVRARVIEAFRGIPATVITCGTGPDIGALVAELQTKYAPSVRAITYGLLPAGAEASPLDALRYWADLLAAGDPIGRTRVLALGGGQDAAAECQMALALGVPVGVVGAVGVLSAPPWAVHPLLRVLTTDTAALHAFLGGN